MRLQAVLGHDGGDSVPLALCQGRELNESVPPNWISFVQDLARAPLLSPDQGWGSPRKPVFVTSSNFGVGSLYAFRRTGDERHLRYGTPSGCIAWLREMLSWGRNVTTFSHACVSAHLGLLQASRALAAGTADTALVFSFDFLSPFVTAGFNALKILNSEMPAPYRDQPTGSIGLGDGVAFAVLTRDQGDFQISDQSLHNEMHHFTANQADGAGFSACIQDLVTAVRGARVWVKGHGTGTLEAGRLEAGAWQRAFPGAPLVSWKGSFGHTLGSCGLVELAITVQALRAGRTPGTVGTAKPTFTDNVAIEDFPNDVFDGVVCASNAFGGAHAAFLLSPV